MARQPIGLDHVLDEIAAEQRSWPKRSQAPDIGGISQISFDIDPRQLTHIDVDDLDIAGAQREEHMILDPGLDTFAHFDRAAAKVEQRREALWRECIERTAEPARLGFEHRCLACSPKRTTMTQSHVAAKVRRIRLSRQTPPPGKHRGQRIVQECTDCGSAGPGKEPHLRHRIKVTGHEDVDDGAKAADRHEG